MLKCWMPATFLTLTIGLAFLGARPASAQAGEPAPEPTLIAGPHEIRVLRDIIYHDGDDHDPEKHKLDLYLPMNLKNYPVLFFIHGGGWTIGDRRMFGSLGPVFARNGIGVVMVSYRLSPKVKHPAHIEDVARAYAWTHKHIGEYDGRADRIFVSGQSAGGHLAALLCTNEKYLKAQGLTLKDVRAAIPVSGVYSIRPGFLRNAFGMDPVLTADASPLERITGKEPPFLILYADKDMSGCAMMSGRFGEELKKKHVPAEVIEIKGRNHVSIMLRMMINESDATVQQMFRFIARYSDLKLSPRTAVSTEDKKPQ